MVIFIAADVPLYQAYCHGLSRVSVDSPTLSLVLSTYINVIVQRAYKERAMKSLLCNKETTYGTKRDLSRTKQRNNANGGRNCRNKQTTRDLSHSRSAA